MRYADANVIKIKHAVLEEVARLAFAGELEERKDEIAFKLIPGPTPQFRCCIYKADPRTDSAVPLLYLQRAGDHPAACPPGGRQSAGNNGRRQYYPGHQFGLRGLSDLQLHRDRELPELSGQGLH